MIFRVLFLYEFFTKLENPQYDYTYVYILSEYIVRATQTLS